MYGIDPQVLLRRWCELECSSYTMSRCEGISEPSPELMSRIEQNMFRMSAPRNAACIAACDVALPVLLAREYPIERYFANQDGYRIGRELQSRDPDDQRCGPGEPIFQNATAPQPVPASTEEGLSQYLSLPSLPSSTSWLPVATGVVIVGAVILFGPMAALAL